MDDSKSLSDKYNIGADGLNDFQRDCNNARWKMGIPEDDERPYLIVSGVDLLGLPKRTLIPVEGEIEDIQVSVWGFLDRLAKKAEKIDCEVTLIGPRDSAYSSFSPIFGDDVRVLKILKDVVLAPVYRGAKFSTAAYESRLT